jgi:hypothetical protein
MWALSFTFFVFAAKWIVESVYAIDSYFEESVAMRIVLEFPPNESRKTLVSTESR